MVAQAQASGGRAQVLADRFAAALFYLATGTAVLTVLVWTALGQPDEAVVRAVTVLVIACPHALGLAIPLVVALSTALAARSGILVKDRLALERMRTVDAVLFDKTGTLTRGEHAVTDLVTASGVERDEVLRIAARCRVGQRTSVGPGDRGGGRAAPARPGPPGSGRCRAAVCRATIDGTEYAVGGPALLRELGLSRSRRSWRPRPGGGRRGVPRCCTWCGCRTPCSVRSR